MAPAVPVRVSWEGPDGVVAELAGASGGQVALAYSAPMVLSRRWAVFLVGVGIWTWVIWPRFAVAIWQDPRSWASGTVADGAPTSFLWVHALLIGASLVIGTTVGVLGIRAWLVARRRQAS